MTAPALVSVDDGPPQAVYFRPPFGATLSDVARTLRVTPRELVECNGGTFTTAGIDAWILCVGGHRLPFDELRPFDRARSLGWAVLGSRPLLVPVAFQASPGLVVGTGPVPRARAGWELSRRGRVAVGALAAAGLLAWAGGFNLSTTERP